MREVHLKDSLMMWEDKSYVWLKKVTDKDIKEKDLSKNFLNKHQKRQIQADFWVVLFWQELRKYVFLKN